MLSIRSIQDNLSPLFRKYNEPSMPVEYCVFKFTETLFMEFIIIFISGSMFFTKDSPKKESLNIFEFSVLIPSQPQKDSVQVSLALYGLYLLTIVPTNTGTSSLMVDSEALCANITEPGIEPSTHRPSDENANHPIKIKYTTHRARPCPIKIRSDVFRLCPHSLTKWVEI